MNDSSEDLYQCIGYCQVDDAGYCLGCGRPWPAMTARCVSETGGMRDEMPAADCVFADNRFPVDPLPQ